MKISSKEYGDALPLTEEDKDWEEVKRDDDDEGIADGDLSSIRAGIMEACKVVRIIETTRRNVDRNVWIGNGGANGFKAIARGHSFSV